MHIYGVMSTLNTKCFMYIALQGVAQRCGVEAAGTIFVRYEKHASPTTELLFGISCMSVHFRTNDFC